MNPPRIASSRYAWPRIPTTDMQRVERAMEWVALIVNLADVAARYPGTEVTRVIERLAPGAKPCSLCGRYEPHRSGPNDKYHHVYMRGDEWPE